MSASNEQGSIVRRILLSILTGLGVALLGFFAGAILSGVLIFMFFTIFGTFTEVGPMMVIYVSPIIGGLVAIIAGIRGGIKTYNNPQTTKRSDDFYKSFQNEESMENFSTLTYRQKFAITEYGYLLSPEDAEVVGKMLGNFKEKDVLPYCQEKGKKVSGFE